MRMNKLFKIGAGLVSALMLSASLGTVAFAAGGVTIGEITASTTSSSDYYNVTVNYSGVDTATTTQLTIFAYDITNVVDGDVSTEFDEATPVGWINQSVSAEKGQIKFKVAKGNAAVENIAAFNEDSTILIKVGGTDITPDAKLYSFADVEESSVVLGDVNNDSVVNNKDAIAVMKHFLSIETIEDNDSLTAGDVNKDGSVNNKDAIAIMKHFLSIESLPE